MKRPSADRIFFYVVLLLVTILTLWLVRGFIGPVVLAVTAAVVLHPMHDWFRRHTGNRKGLATALTLVTAVPLLVIPALLAVWLLFDALTLLSSDVVNVMQDREDELVQSVHRIEQWLVATGWADRLQLDAGDLTQSVRDFVAGIGRASVTWLASAAVSAVHLVMPAIIFISVLGTLLSNSEQALQLLKELSPLDDEIDQLFLDRMRIITKGMMLSIVVVAIVQGLVTGLLMALGGTPNIVGLTLLATLLAILPGGAAIVAVPVGIVHIIHGDIWAGIIIAGGTLTFVASLANQVRPRMVSREVFLNRAFMLMCVLSGLAVFGVLGVVYGPLIMILFTTVIEVYLAYFRPGRPSVTVSSNHDVALDETIADEAN